MKLEAKMSSLIFLYRQGVVKNPLIASMTSFEAPSTQTLYNNVDILQQKLETLVLRNNLNMFINSESK